MRLQAIAVIAWAACSASCSRDSETADVPSDPLAIIAGRATQWNGAISRDAFAQSGVSPSVVPNDPASYVGTSKVFAPGVRYDLYYVAIAGPADQVGQVLCVAPGTVTLRDIDGFERNDRALATEVWGADTCGWGLEGTEQQTVYAWDGSTSTLRLWQPDAEHPVDIVPAPGDDILKLCESPTITLSGQAGEQHPGGVCDLAALHGPDGYRLSDEPWQ